MVLAILVLLPVVFYYGINARDRSPRTVNTAEPVEQDQNHTMIGSEKYVLEIVDEADKRQRGLSGRSSLPEGRGMLFIFPAIGNHGIWMKEMNFPIDIIWLDTDARVVGLTKEVQPDSYPDVFYADKDSLYVIEINAGEISKNNIKIGDAINLKLGGS